MVYLCFPEYELIFKNNTIYSSIALDFIEKYPHANIISNTRIDCLQNFFKKHNFKYWKAKPIKIKEYAINSYPSVNMNDELVSNLSQMAKLVNEYQKAIDIIKDKVDMIFLDFHAEATAEKQAMGYFLDGKITAMFGTHSHVQTADEKIMENGTGYISDIGMTGPKQSILGMDRDAALKRFLTSLPEKYKVATGEAMFNGCVFKVDDKTNKVTEIIRIS